MNPPTQTTTDAAPAAARAWLPVIACALAGCAVFAFFGNAVRGYINTHSLFGWWGAQWFNPAADMQHGPIVLIVALWLFWRNLRKNTASSSCLLASQTRWRGPAVMCVALVLHLLGYAVQQTRISIVALLIFIWGSLAFADACSGLCNSKKQDLTHFGKMPFAKKHGPTSFASAAVFPLGFMLLAVPFGFLDTLGFYLRLGIVKTVAGLTHLAGLGVVRSGTQLFSSDGLYQYDVVAACSGIRSLVALLALALLIGYISVRGWKRRAALAVLCVPFVFLGNVVRITLIVLAGEWFGHNAGARVHDWSGWLVFAVVFLLLLGAAKLLRRDSSLSASPEEKSDRELERAPEHEGQATADIFPPLPSASPLSLARKASACMLACVLALACLCAWATCRLDVISTRAQAGVRLAPDGVNPAPLPDFLGSTWGSMSSPVTDTEREILPPDTGYSRRIYYGTTDPAGQVLFSIVLSGRDRTSIHRPELCLVGQGWTIVKRDLKTFTLPDGMTLDTTLLRAERDVTFANGRRTRVSALFAYWFAGADTITPSYTGMLWHDACERLLHLRADRWAYVITQTIDFDGESKAVFRMAAIIANTWPQVRARKN